MCIFQHHGFACGNGKSLDALDGEMNFGFGHEEVIFGKSWQQKMVRYGFVPTVWLWTKAI